MASLAKLVFAHVCLKTRRGINPCLSMCCWRSYKLQKVGHYEETCRVLLAEDCKLRRDGH